MNDEINLLPCPFCGNAKNIAMVNEKHDHSGAYFIACPECGASTILRYAMGDDPKPLLIESWNRRAAAQAAQPEAVGWELVPIEPTPAMLVAMWDHRESMRGQSENRIARAGYAAMLAAAPTPEPMSAPTAEPVPADCDVRTIMLDVVPGWDGEGVEVYAKSAQDVIEVLTKLSQRLEDWELGIRRLATPPSAATPEPSDAERREQELSPTLEEWVMDLAEKHNLGRRVGQIGTMRGVEPDVFYTDASYRTRELFDFAAELLAADELSTKERRGLVVNWFAEDWAIHQALGLLDDYDTERAAIRATKGGKL